MALDEKSKELLKKLKEAGKPKNYFTLTLTANDTLLDEITFPAEKYSLEAISEKRTHFLMKDLMREVIKAFTEEEKK